MGTTKIFEHSMQAMGLTPRPQQEKLVQLARHAIDLGLVRHVQAGTGVGKSFAVLTTALEAARANRQPSIVVCPNNSLIDQYVLKDAPRIKKATGGKFVYVKGRSRYLCSQARALQKACGENDKKARQMYADMTSGGKVEWADHGLDRDWGCPGAGDCDSNSAWSRDEHCDLHSGHRSSCTELDADVKPWECECKGDHPTCSCRYYCGAFEAKRMADTADVVITNAHVLVWDYLVQQFTGGQVRLLPMAGALFVDECHELEAVGRGCQSDEIKPGSKVYDVIPELRVWADRQAFKMIEAGQQEGLLSRDEDIVKMAEEAKKLAEDLEDKANIVGQEPELMKEYQKEAKRLMRFVDFVAENDNFISTVELQPVQPFEDPTVNLRRICIDTSWVFREILTSQASVLVSGTIPASDPKRLGVGDLSKIEDVGHPFDYSKSRLVISNHRGNDRSAGYKRSEQVAQAINSKGGGALILFTSWRDLEEFMPMIVHNLDPHIRNEVYVQSKEDPASLKQDIEEFRQNGNAVLAGVRSLWTGLDIPGDALRTVIIWKLPYGVPTLEWQAIQRVHGRDTYFDSMLMVLTQGIGRLVRSTEDSGLVFIVDSRAMPSKWRSNGMTRHLCEFSK